jgi:hypothetical protein
MSTDDELFTRSEVLGGFSAKRARFVLATWYICSRMMREKYELRAYDC